MSVAWTDKHLDILRSRWADGVSADEIGHQIGRSVDAIWHKVRALGLPRREDRVSPSYISSPSVPVRRQRLLICTIPYVQPHVGPAPTCQWIEADPRVDATCCGERSVPGRSWCVRHVAVACIRTVRQEAA